MTIWCCSVRPGSAKRIEAVLAGYQVIFSTVHDLVDRFCQALADHTATKTMNWILRHDLTILDELGFLELDSTGSDHFFHRVAKAYEKRSFIVTSNLDFSDWGIL